VTDIPIIDASAIDSLRELNPGDGGEFLREIVAIYVEDTPNRIADLKKSLAAGDLASFTRAAHTIKGSSSNVGAAVLRGVAERLEMLSKREGLGNLAPLIASCETEFARASEELRKIVR
jgi:HPt (histidine-containing phosphotransfer) domain-containing protein